MRALLSSLLLIACVRAEPAVERGAELTVVLVRHAEKGTEPKADPPLTPAGAERANQLIEAIAPLTFTAVITTDFERTRATAAPLAAKLNVTAERVDARAKDHAAQVAATARARGGTVLVVGHSNTVTEIIAALGAPKPAPICEGEFDRLFIVHVPAAGAATVEERRYGARTEDESCRTP
ncbi:MAG: histidine phosphatase family protein [Myxococcaceae bacterium]|nr:histidine phosphatase family protein [Myxococcaceae bacterium]